MPAGFNGLSPARLDSYEDFMYEVDGLNFGISGDCTENILWRVLNGELPDGFNPAVIFIQVGTNDLVRRRFRTALEVNSIAIISKKHICLLFVLGVVVWRVKTTCICDSIVTQSAMSLACD